MNTTDPDTAPENRAHAPRLLWARRGFAACAWIVLLALLGQTYTAGMAIFVDPAWWAWHLTVIHWYDWLTVALLVLAFVGRLDARLKWLSAATIVLIYVQYATAGLHTSATWRVLAALHPVSGMLLFWVTALLALGARRE